MLYTPELGDQITKRLAEFKLSSAAEQTTKRFLDAGHDQALVILAEVLEVEWQARRERRVDRLRRASRLPPAKTFDTLDPARVPRNVLIQARDLARGGFVSAATTFSCSDALVSARATSRVRSATHSSAQASACSSSRRTSSFNSYSRPAAISACRERFARSTRTTS